MPTKTTQSKGMSDDTKTLITVLLLIFVNPIGVVFMWVWMKWQSWIKILITVGSLLLLLISFFIFFMFASFIFKPAIGGMTIGNCYNQCKQSSNPEACTKQCVEDKLNVQIETDQ